MADAQSVRDPDAHALALALGVRECEDCKYEGEDGFCMHPKASNGVGHKFACVIERKNFNLPNDCGPNARNFEPK